LISVLSKRLNFLLSVPLMLEYEAVLKRPEHLAAAGATRGDIDAILDALAARGLLVRGQVPQPLGRRKHDS
jgi:hypothetical protein